MRDLLRDGMARQLLEHDVDVDQTVRTAPHQNDRRLDVACGELGNLVVLGAVRGDRARRLVVVHLEYAIADDLEPMHYTLRARERVQMWVRGEFLVWRDIDRSPPKQEPQTCVDEPDEDGRIQNALPHRRARQNCLPPKSQVKNIRARLHKRVHGPTCNALRTHRRRQRNENINLLVQRRMNTQRRKRLRRSLTEPNIAQARLMRGFQNIANRIRNVMERELIHTEVPKPCLRWCGMYALLAILVSPVIAEPDIVAALDQLKG